MDSKWNYIFSVFYYQNERGPSQDGSDKIKEYKFQNLPGLIAELSELILFNHNNMKEEGDVRISYMELSKFDQPVFRIFTSLEGQNPDDKLLILAFNGEEEEQSFINESRIDFGSILNFDNRFNGYKIATCRFGKEFELQSEIDSLLTRYPYKKIGFKTLLGINVLSTKNSNSPDFLPTIQLDSYFHYKTLYNAISHIVSLPLNTLSLNFVRCEGGINRAEVLDSFNKRLLSIGFYRDEFNPDGVDLCLYIHQEMFRWGGEDLDKSQFKLGGNSQDVAFQLPIADIDYDKWIYKPTPQYVTFRENNHNLVNLSIYNPRDFALRFEFKPPDGDVTTAGMYMLFNSLEDTLDYFDNLDLIRIFSEHKAGDLVMHMKKIVIYSSITGEKYMEVEKRRLENEQLSFGMFVFTVDEQGSPRQYLEKKFENISHASVKEGKATFNIYFKTENLKGRHFKGNRPPGMSM